ncbi:Uncharacterized protein family (UPF0104) [Beggiatoa alba B18LD]|uniref:Uncharacterized protein family (UPF0104) n=1 Tax=Beggiatoa alba B18LD TaxID=395493 RepID=I3CCT5_9GAMM|nr:hypothetical protein [Beggiatoa alba]EIJ41428.1 Uncharacterized protein family (UPF0104) [Beggiatoa alba B18LD]
MLRLIKRFWLIGFIICALIFIIRYLWIETHKFTFPLTFNTALFWFTLLLQILFLSITASVWQYIVFTIGKANITFNQSFIQQTLLTMGKYLPGKVWGMIARGSQLKAVGLNWQQVVNLTLQEQLTLVHAGGVVSACFLAILYNQLIWWGLAVIAFISIFLGKQVLILAFYLYQQLGQLFLKKHPISLENLQLPSHYEYLMMVSGFMLAWLVLGLLYSGVYFTFTLQTLPILPSIAWITLANTIGVTLGFFALFAPAGIGVRESITTMFLLNIMPLEQAVMSSLLFRFWTVGAELLTGLILLFWLGKKPFNH